MILKIQRRGRRAAKCTMDNNGQYASFTTFLYNLRGHIVSELSNGAWQRIEAYLGGRHLATFVNGQTYYDFSDWLGTERSKLGYANGALAASLSETCTSGPWGDNLNCSNSLSDLHFTGKMRDAESGLDYFGARYYSGAGLGFGDFGRFMTPDWSAKVEPVPYAKMENPQSLNLYAYMMDNPVSGVDANGHWPTWIHNLIYKKALPHLTELQLKTIDNASHAVDDCWSCQSKAKAYQHSMRAPGESVHDAVLKAQAFINQHLQTASNDQSSYIAHGGKGLSPSALKEFGTAIHTLTDAISPAHAGFQVWHGKFHLIDAWKHHERENSINSEQLNRSVNVVRAAFKEIFGLKALDQATGDSQ